MPAISTSSPGSKPAASSARITPERAQALLHVAQGLVVVHVVPSDQPLDAARPSHANAPGPVRSTLNRRPRPGR